MQEQYSKLVSSHAYRSASATSRALAGQAQGGIGSLRVRPNPSVKRTGAGRPSLAFISFWAKAALPAPAAYLER